MEGIRQNFKFLIGETKIHPTTKITLEYLVKQDAVCAVIFDNTLENVYLVKQYRPGCDGLLLEIVAGLIDKGEEPIHAVYREILEETGFSKSDFSRFVKLGNAQYVSPGYTTEKLYYYAGVLKKDAKPKEQHLDLGEDITVVKMSTKEILKTSVDSKTTFAISYFLGVLK